MSTTTTRSISSSNVRLVCFDALYTIITPRLPVYVQYAQTFEPYLGTLKPEAIKASFKKALKQVQTERPSYAQGHENWWGEVIRRTAVGAGALPEDVETYLPKIVPSLLKRFSSREGYRLYDDTVPTWPINYLYIADAFVRCYAVDRLQELGIKTALVSNTDSRILKALEDLGALQRLDPVLISENEGIEKPSKQIFLLACERAGVKPEEAIHIGDELACDYHGATNAGLQALLLRRLGPEGEEAHKEDVEDLTDVRTIESLGEIVEIVDTR